MSSSDDDYSCPSMPQSLNKIGRRFWSLHSSAAILKKDLLLLSAIINFMPHQKYTRIYRKISSLEFTFFGIEITSSTPKATMDNIIKDYMLKLRDIKPAIKGLFAIHLEKEYDSDDILGVWTFVQQLEVFQREIVDEEAVTSVQNLRAYLDLTKHLAEVCERNKALVNEIWKHARGVADHTAIFLYSWLIEKDADLQLIGHNLTLAHLLQMTDPTQGASSLYLQIFHSLGLSNDPLPGELDTDELSLIDHLLLRVDNRITHYQECHDGFRVDKLVAYETLVKASVSYSPQSDKMILCRSTITYATAVLPFSVSIDSQEKNMDESFDKLVDKLVDSGFIGHLLHYDHKSLKGQLKELSECMALARAIVSYPPLRHLFSKIIFQKFIVKLVITASSSSSAPSCCSLWEHVFPFHFFSSPNNIGNENLIDVYKICVKQLTYYNKQQLDMEYEVIGEQAIGQYIDGLEEVQKQCLISNTKAIISIENLRSFQHLGKVIVNWYKNEDLLNNLKTQLLLVVERTTIFLCSCWLEPEKNQELKLTQLLQMNNILNAKVQDIYVQGFKTLTWSIDSPWPNELAEASFIDHMLLYLRALIQCQTRSLVASLKERLENLHGFLTVLKNTVRVKDSVPSSRHQYIIPSKMRAFHSVLIEFARTMATISIADSEDAEKENLVLLLDLEEKFILMKTELRNSTIIDYPSIGFEFKSFFENLKEMLTLISPEKHELDTVYAEMLKLSSFLERIMDKRIENKEQVKDLQQRIIQVSHKADFIIQSYVNREGTPYYHALQLLVIKEDIQLLTTEIKGYDTDDSSYGSIEEKYEHRSSEGSTSTTTDMMVGLDDESQLRPWSTLQEIHKIEIL